MISGILFLVMTLAWTLATLQGFSTLSHEQEMERLELKKEISLINKNSSDQDNNNFDIVKILEYEKQLKQLEVRTALCEYTLYVQYGHTIN